MKNIGLKGFYFITDSGLSLAGSMADVAGAVNAGVNIVQYRRKSGSTKAVYQEALYIRRLCRETLFIVNDRVDIALAVEADGVHLGQDDLPISVVRHLLAPGRIIGVSVGSSEEALQAQKDGADYIGVGPIYRTATKHDAGTPVGIKLIEEIRTICNLPIAAIGGITPENAAGAIAAGAEMVCAIGATVSTPNVEDAVRSFQALFETVGKEERSSRI